MPDLPVYKACSGTLLNGNANRGFHYNGCIRFPPSCRFNRPLGEYVKKNASCFRRYGISRIDVEAANRTLSHLADYATKTVKRSLVSIDEIYVLPLSGSEMRRNTRPITPYEKAIKDLEASANYSRELAEAIYTWGKCNTERNGPSVSSPTKLSPGTTR